MIALIRELKAQLDRPSKTPLEMAREQVILYERLEQVEAEKQLAIKTKAEIGSRREATAMNTASTQTKKANKLEIELGQSKEWMSLKSAGLPQRTELEDGTVKQTWRILKALSEDRGAGTREVFDANYGTVKAYHKSIIAEYLNSFS